MALVPAAPEDEVLDQSRIDARKINPAYARGRLVRVAVGRNQSESELIAGMLLEEGIPSMLRRSGGFDVPDFLAAGPRDVMVPESGERAARTILAEVDELADSSGEAADRGPQPGPTFKLAAGFLALLLTFGAVAGFFVLLLR